MFAERGWSSGVASAAAAEGASAGHAAADGRDEAEAGGRLGQLIGPPPWERLKFDAAAERAVEGAKRIAEACAHDLVTAEMFLACLAAVPEGRAQLAAHGFDATAARRVASARIATEEPNAFDTRAATRTTQDCFALWLNLTAEHVAATRSAFNQTVETQDLLATLSSLEVRLGELASAHVPAVRRLTDLRAALRAAPAPTLQALIGDVGTQVTAVGGKVDDVTTALGAQRDAVRALEATLVARTAATEGGPALKELLSGARWSRRQIRRERWLTSQRHKRVRARFDKVEAQVAQAMQAQAATLDRVGKRIDDVNAGVARLDASPRTVDLAGVEARLAALGDGVTALDARMRRSDRWLFGVLSIVSTCLLLALAYALMRPSGP